MKKSPEFNPDMHSYEFLGPGALGAFSEVEALVQRGLLVEAKSGWKKSSAKQPSPHSRRHLFQMPTLI